jgi:hypothetical protein
LAGWYRRMARRAGACCCRQSVRQSVRQRRAGGQEQTERDTCLSKCRNTNWESREVEGGLAGCDRCVLCTLNGRKCVAVSRGVATQRRGCWREELHMPALMALHCVWGWGRGAAGIWTPSGTLHCCSCCALFALWRLVYVQVQLVPLIGLDQ